MPLLALDLLKDDEKKIFGIIEKESNRTDISKDEVTHESTLNIVHRQHMGPYHVIKAKWIGNVSKVNFKKYRSSFAFEFLESDEMRFGYTKNDVELLLTHEEFGVAYSINRISLGDDGVINFELLEFAIDQNVSIAKEEAARNDLKNALLGSNSHIQFNETVKDAAYNKYIDVKDKNLHATSNNEHLINLKNDPRVFRLE